MEGYHREGTSVSREDGERRRERKLEGDCEIPGWVGYEGEGLTLAGGEREMTKVMVAVNRRGGEAGPGGVWANIRFTYFPHEYFFWGMVSDILFGQTLTRLAGELSSP